MEGGPRGLTPTYEPIGPGYEVIILGYTRFLMNGEKLSIEVDKISKFGYYKVVFYFRRGVCLCIYKER